MDDYVSKPIRMADLEQTLIRWGKPKNAVVPQELAG